MLFIFDLDDTLIDTSGSVIPYKLREALQILMEGGLSLDLEKDFEELLTLSQKVKKTKEALFIFAKEKGAHSELIQRALNSLKSPLPNHFEVPTTPFAKEVLEAIQKKYLLSLVTAGDPNFQMEKLKKAGIDGTIFSMISVSKEGEKKKHYENIQKKIDMPPNQIWVCGDRVLSDLYPAFELGFHTIHMKWGRGKLEKSESWINHTITQLREIQNLRLAL